MHFAVSKRRRQNFVVALSWSTCGHCLDVTCHKLLGTMILGTMITNLTGAAFVLWYQLE